MWCAPTVCNRALYRCKEGCLTMLRVDAFTISNEGSFRSQDCETGLRRVIGIHQNQHPWSQWWRDGDGMFENASVSLFRDSGSRFQTPFLGCWSLAASTRRRFAAQRNPSWNVTRHSAGEEETISGKYRCFWLDETRYSGWCQESESVLDGFSFFDPNCVSRFWCSFFTKGVSGQRRGTKRRRMININTRHIDSIADPIWRIFVVVHYLEFWTIRGKSPSE